MKIYLSAGWSSQYVSLSIPYVVDVAKLAKMLKFQNFGRKFRNLVAMIFWRHKPKNCPGL